MGLRASIFLKGRRAQSLSGNVCAGKAAEFSTALLLSWQEKIQRHIAAPRKQGNHFMHLNYEKKLMAILIKF
jgi:hypothetical protein